MRTWETLLRSLVFSIGTIGFLLFLSVSVHFALGRVLFAILIAAICLIAELFVLVKAIRLMWRWSDTVATALLRIIRRDSTGRVLLTEIKN